VVRVTNHLGGPGRVIGPVCVCLCVWTVTITQIFDMLVNLHTLSQS